MLERYENLNAKYWQEHSADHAEWALDALLSGDIVNARLMQNMAAEFSAEARREMNIVEIPAAKTQTEVNP